MGEEEMMIENQPREERIEPEDCASLLNALTIDRSADLQIHPLIFIGAVTPLHDSGNSLNRDSSASRPHDWLASRDSLKTEMTAEQYYSAYLHRRSAAWPTALDFSTDQNRDVRVTLRHYLHNKHTNPAICAPTRPESQCSRRTLMFKSPQHRRQMIRNDLPYLLPLSLPQLTLYSSPPMAQDHTALLRYLQKGNVFPSVLNPTVDYHTILATAQNAVNRHFDALLKPLYSMPLLNDVANLQNVLKTEQLLKEARAVIAWPTNTDNALMSEEANISGSSLTTPEFGF